MDAGRAGAPGVRPKRLCADPTITDLRYGTTPLEWAEHAYQLTAAELLRNRAENWSAAYTASRISTVNGPVIPS
ncbi:Uncharacterised protein [Mycobacteroides abscessus subsp. abscessus]|nr:Uncharacterised protein [Mycobacteroides abscessus subsp. abscessus]